MWTEERRKASDPVCGGWSANYLLQYETKIHLLFLFTLFYNKKVKKILKLYYHKKSSVIKEIHRYPNIPKW